MNKHELYIKLLVVDNEKQQNNGVIIKNRKLSIRRKLPPSMVHLQELQQLDDVVDNAPLEFPETPSIVLVEDSSCDEVIPKKRKSPKNKNVIIPTSVTRDTVFSKTYTLSDLKEICLHYGLKRSGTKPELVERIHKHLSSLPCAIALQRAYRAHLYRKYKTSGGPALMRRKLCVNDSDFFTMEPVAEIAAASFFSYQDVDNFVYGFDVVSLYHLIIKLYPETKNPYNRNEIPMEALAALYSRLHLSKIFNQKLELSINMDEIPPEKKRELNIIDLFQEINNLGNYSDAAWFNNLSTAGYLRFLREMSEIWDYRAELTREMKMAICPPNGNPFYGIPIATIRSYVDDPSRLKMYCVRVIENLIRNSSTADRKCLGAYYVLAALTTVSMDARAALPWLYESIA